MSEAAKMPPTIHMDLDAIFVSMELSRSICLITSLSPGKGEKMSKRQVRAGDTGGLFEVFRKLQDDVRVRTGRDCPIVTIQEAGIDGFWIHRVLRTEGIESHIVDLASVAVSRRYRRAKTDRIDGEALLRVLMAYKRGEPRVCSMLRVPAPDEEDRRRPWRTAVRENGLAARACPLQAGYWNRPSHGRPDVRLIGFGKRPDHAERLGTWNRNARSNAMKN